MKVSVFKFILVSFAVISGANAGINLCQNQATLTYPVKGSLNQNLSPTDPTYSVSCVSFPNQAALATACTFSFFGLIPYYDCSSTAATTTTTTSTTPAPTTATGRKNLCKNQATLTYPVQGSLNQNLSLTDPLYNLSCVSFPNQASLGTACYFSSFGLPPYYDCSPATAADPNVVCNNMDKYNVSTTCVSAAYATTSQCNNGMGATDTCFNLGAISAYSVTLGKLCSAGHPMYLC